jgi:hypothetical protein
MLNKLLLGHQGLAESGGLGLLINRGLINRLLGLYRGSLNRRLRDDCRLLRFRIQGRGDSRSFLSLGLGCAAESAESAVRLQLSTAVNTLHKNLSFFVGTINKILPKFTELVKETPGNKNEI